MSLLLLLLQQLLLSLLLLLQQLLLSLLLLSLLPLLSQLLPLPSPPGLASVLASMG